MTTLRAPRLGLPSRRLLSLVLVAAAGIIATPAAARAHAHLRRSAPTAGAAVSPPQAIRLWFTETPELALTRVTLLDSSGAPVTVGAAEREPEGAMGVRVRIEQSLAPGRYTVRWTTAAADGHPSSGSFTFRVLAEPGASPTSPADSSRLAGSGATATPPRAPAARASTTPAAPPEAASESESVRPVAVLTRAAWLATIVVLLGAIAFRLLILARTDAFEREGREAAAARLADHALLVCAVFILATVARLYLQTRMMSGQLSASPAPLRTLMMNTGWGVVWRMQLGAGVLALLGLLAARRRLGVGWVIAAVAGGVIAVGAALSGHAAAAERLSAFAVVDDALHIVGASGWLGSLFWVVAVGIVSLRRAGDQPARRIAALVSSFSPVALSCAALVAVSGVVSAWLRLGSLSALSATSYGQVLLLKLALVAAAAGVGLYNWRRLRPSLGSDLAAARLRRSATAELAVGGVIVLVTALLVGLPTPVPGVR